jgi:predicted ATPase/DNA-binding CsgD family transcriptional regulator
VDKSCIYSLNSLKWIKDHITGNQHGFDSKGEVVTHNLPVQLTKFIGRQPALADLERLLADSRLISLTGPAGCGKTRLAMQFASRVSGSFKDGVCLAELAPIRDPTFVPLLLTKVLNITNRPEQSALEALLHYLQSKEILLVLDNCEHLIAGCAQLVGQILSQTGGVHILVTSREPLAVPGEMVYPVPGLELPPAGAGVSVNPQDLLQYDAVHLFVERTRAILPNFTITTANALNIVKICRQLDGLPLALELASAHTNVLSLQEILARLDDRFALLISSQRAKLDPRHGTLRTAMDWSYDLLSPSEQTLLRRLSVFARDCSLATIEDICAGDGLEREQILGLLSSLVNKSLVVANTLLYDEARYSLLATIRQYGQEKLISSGERSVIHDRHLRFYLEFSEEMDTKLRGEHQSMWLNKLDAEYDNIRAALSWTVEDSHTDNNRVSAGLRITSSLYQFWRIRDYIEEGLDWCKQLFARSDDSISSVVRAKALVFASLMAGIRGQIEDQMKYGEQALFLSEAAGEEGRQTHALALGIQGYAARKAGNDHTAFSLALKEIQLLRELGDIYQLGLSLSLNSFYAMSIGLYEEARAMLDEAFPLLQQSGDLYRIAMAFNYLGDLDRCEGKYQEAETAYEESISLLRKINAIRDLASALYNLGHTCLHLGKIERAIELFNESLALHQEQANRLGMTECLLGFAALAIVANLPAAGARLLSAAVTIGGQHISSEWATTRMEYEHYLERARAGLTTKMFRSEQTAGQRLSLDKAFEYAQGLVQKVVAAQQIRQQLEQLTPREYEVAMLIAQAKSNAEIAEELVVSKRTIESHIASIRSKLGFTARSQIVRWVIESDLVKASE